MNPNSYVADLCVECRLQESMDEDQGLWIAHEKKTLNREGAYRDCTVCNRARRDSRGWPGLTPTFLTSRLRGEKPVLLTLTDDGVEGRLRSWTDEEADAELRAPRRSRSPRPELSFSNTVQTKDKYGDVFTSVRPQHPENRPPIRPGTPGFPLSGLPRTGSLATGLSSLALSAPAPATVPGRDAALLPLPMEAYMGCLPRGQGLETDGPDGPWAPRVYVVDPDYLAAHKRPTPNSLDQRMGEHPDGSFRSAAAQKLAEIDEALSTPW